MQIRVVILAICLLVSSSCMPHYVSRVNYVYSSLGNYIKVNTSNPMSYKNTAKGVGDSLARTSYKFGDSLRYYAYQVNKGWCYLVFDGKDSIWLKQPEILTSDAFDANLIIIGNKITVDKDKLPDAWSRMVVWINKNSDMKIQTSSDNIIDTFNPIRNGTYGFTATKQTSGNTGTIELECKYSGILNNLNGECINKTKSGLYYALKGINVPYFEF